MGLLDTLMGLASAIAANNPQLTKELGTDVDKWNSRWVCIGKLAKADLKPYNHCVGLYRHEIGGRIMYIGRAVEYNNGGFRKRLSDYRRESNSARTHTSGRTINQHLDEITTYILIVGSDANAAQLTKKLEPLFIEKYNPPWNNHYN